MTEKSKLKTSEMASRIAELEATVKEHVLFGKISAVWLVQENGEPRLLHTGSYREYDGPILHRAEMAEQRVTILKEQLDTRQALSDLKVRIKVAEQEAKNAATSWNAAESRLVHICQLLGVDFCCEEPETCEQVIQRMNTQVDVVYSLVLEAECKTADKDAILSALDGATC